MLDCSSFLTSFVCERVDLMKILKLIYIQIYFTRAKNQIIVYNRMKWKQDWDSYRKIKRTPFFNCWWNCIKIVLSWQMILDCLILVVQKVGILNIYYHNMCYSNTWIYNSLRIERYYLIKILFNKLNAQNLI